jgi:hypothetical protein
MLTIVGVAVCVVMLILVITAPGMALLFYGATAEYADGYGISEYLGHAFGSYKLIMRGLYLLLFAAASLTLVHRARVRAQAYPRGVVWLPLAICVWVVVTGVVKGYGWLGSLSLLPYVGLPVFVIWLAFAHGHEFRKYFYGYVLFQIALAVGVLFLRPLSVLDGARYKALGGHSVTATAGVNLALPSGDTVKEALGHYAQYHNPNVLGLYACIALACGLALLRRGGGRAKIIAIVFITLGGIAWLNSLTRGPMIGVLLGIFLGYFFGGSPDAAGNRAFNPRRLVALPIGFLVVVALTSSHILSYLVPSSSNVSVTGRLSGYSLGLDAIRTAPIMGVGRSWSWGTVGYPHFLGLLFASIYGVWVGIAVCIVCFWYGGRAAAYAMRNAGGHSRLVSSNLLALLLVCTIWGIALTDNLTAPVAFWMCLAEAIVLSCESSVPRAAVSIQAAR